MSFLIGMIAMALSIVGFMYKLDHLVWLVLLLWLCSAAAIVYEYYDDQDTMDDFLTSLGVVLFFSNGIVMLFF